MGQSTEWACTFLKIESFNHLISILRSNTQCRKMIRHTLKILQQLMQDFYIVSDHFTMLRSKGFRSILTLIFFRFYLCFSILLIKVGEKYIFCLHLECCRNISGLGRSKKLGLEGFQLGGVITPITYHDTVEYFWFFETTEVVLISYMKIIMILSLVARKLNHFGTTKKILNMCSLPHH